MKWSQLWLVAFIFALTHADTPCKTQDSFERHSKDANEAIVHYLAEMVTLTNLNISPDLKTEQMIGKLKTLKDSIDTVIDATEDPKESCMSFFKIFLRSLNLEAALDRSRQ